MDFFGFFQNLALVEFRTSGISIKRGLGQGQLQRWTEHSTLIFENLKPVEISKNLFNII